MVNSNTVCFYKQIDSEEKLYKSNIKPNFNSKHKNINFTVGLENNISTNATDSATKITRLQSAIRGWKIRNETFLSYQILPFIQQHLMGYSPTIYLDVARLICRELNKMSLNPKKYKGKSVKLESELKAYPFKKPGKAVASISRPFSLELEMDTEGKAIKLLLAPDEKYSFLGRKLGSGTYKDVYRAYEFILPRTLEGDQRQVSCTPFVIAKIKMIDDKIENGLIIQEKIIETVKGKFADLPVKSLPTLSGSIDQTEFKQVWYNGDLQKARQSGTIPIDFTLNPETVPFTLKDKVNVFVDVAKSLEAMHNKGIVHHDIKPSNILIKYSPAKDCNKIEGLIGDFDFAQPFGLGLVDDYRYWDTLARRGFVYPSADNYGLVISLGEVLLPNFDEWKLADHPDRLLDNNRFKRYEGLFSSIHTYNALKKLNHQIFEPLKNIFPKTINTKNDSMQLSITYSAEYLLSRIDKFCLNSTELSPDNRIVLENLKKEIIVITGTLYLIRDVVATNVRLQLHLDQFPELLETYTQFTLTDPVAFYKNILLPFINSSSLLREHIQSLQKVLS